MVKNVFSEVTTPRVLLIIIRGIIQGFLKKKVHSDAHEVKISQPSTIYNKFLYMTN